MKLKNLRLDISAITRKPNERLLEVIDEGELHKYDNSSNTSTNIVEGYYVDCAAPHGDTIRVKLPIDAEEKIRDMRPMLAREETVYIIPDNLTIIPYAMPGKNGGVFSGVSAKASDFSIVKNGNKSEEYLDI